MPFSRNNVWANGGDFSDPTILWYARAVAAMKAEALALPTSWRFYGAIHGIDSGLWTTLGYLKPADPMPSNALQQQFWNQCQHGSWFFLPWHRGYLIAFEANVRAQVIKLGGPADWSLPYWNYFKAGESALPPAFASPDWLDGKGNNPLYVVQRYGPNGNGTNVSVPLNQVNLKALSDHQFTGPGSGASKGFGGIDTGFEHGGKHHGGVETQPHDWVHGLVGGTLHNDGQTGGLMSDPDTAALDPIFWLHHGNIDRLWEVWRHNPPTDVNPPDPKWLNGPASLGERSFTMPMPNGSTWTYKPSDMVDLAPLGYSYDDLSPAVPASAPGARLKALGFSPAVADAMGTAQVMKAPGNIELVGASKAPVPVEGGEVRTPVDLDKTVRQKVSSSLTVGAGPAKPDRVFLNLENVTGNSDATAFHVFVGLPEGAKTADHPELLAGSIALFGVRKASEPDGEHGGEGLSFVIEITEIVDKLHLSDKFDVGPLSVSIVPVHEVPKAANIRIGRISIYRQGQ